MKPDKTKLCVYTLMIGNYELLNEQPMAARSDIPFICLTDDPTLTSSTWQVTPVDIAFKMDPIRSQRSLKICPHQVDALADYDRSLYIDNSVILREPPELIIERYGWGPGLSLPSHSFRDSVMDEFIEVAQLGLDDQNRVFEQLNHYLAFADPTLAERPFWTAILLRDHRDPKVRAAMERWALHVLRYSRRDQLSFNAAVRDTGIAPARWEIDNQESWFHTWPHTHQRDRVGGGRHPASSIAPPEARIRQLQHEAEIARSKIAEIYASRSWRLTAPLRAVHRLLRASAPPPHPDAPKARA